MSILVIYTLHVYKPIFRYVTINIIFAVIQCDVAVYYIPIVEILNRVEIQYIPNRSVHADGPRSKYTVMHRNMILGLYSMRNNILYFKQ